MKLARPLLFLLSLSLLAMQRGGFPGFGYDRYSEYGGPSVPSEFYWSRLQYTSSYAGGGSYGYRRFRRHLVPGLSQGRQRLPDCPAAIDPHQLAVAAQRRRSR